MADGRRTGTTGALGRLRPSGALVGVVPFFAYTTVFLLIPTLVVVIGAFLDGDNRPTLGNVEGLSQPSIVRALVQSVVLSAVTAVGGAVIGALLAYAVTRLRAGRYSVMRQFGQTSLLVYWIHVDLCYGLVSRRFHHQLSLAQATLGFVLMTAAMFLVSVAKTKYWDPWRRRAKLRGRAERVEKHPASPNTDNRKLTARIP